MKFKMCILTETKQGENRRREMSSHFWKKESGENVKNKPKKGGGGKGTKTPGKAEKTVKSCQ